MSEIITDKFENTSIQDAELNTDASVLSIKVKQLIEDLRKVSITVKDSLKQDLSGLEPTVKKLNDACNLLNVIPTEVDNQLNAIAPIIAKQILSEMNSNMKVEFDKHIQQCQIALDSLKTNIEKTIQVLSTEITIITSETTSLRETKFKRTLYNVLLFVGISVACSAGSVYFALTQFPQTVRIDHPSNINIEQSRVFVEGHSTFNASKDTKIIKK